MRAWPFAKLHNLANPVDLPVPVECGGLTIIACVPPGRYSLVNEVRAERIRVRLYRSQYR